MGAGALAHPPGNVDRERVVDERAWRATWDTLRFDGLISPCVYVLYVGLGGWHWERPAVVVLGLVVVAVCAVLLIAAARFRPSTGRDVRVWANIIRPAYFAYSSAFGLGLGAVVPPDEIATKSMPPILLATMIVTGAIYGQFRRSIVWMTSVPAATSTILVLLARHDPNRGIVIVGAVILMFVVVVANHAFVQQNAAAINTELDRAELVERLSAERALLDRQLRLDFLTGIPNRLAFNERLAGIGSDTEAVTLVLIDLDGFKSVNDTYGHAVGDQVLVRSAERLTTAVDVRGTVYRLGGDEFAAVLRRRDDADIVRSRIARAFAVPVEVDEHEVMLGASTGAAHGVGRVSSDELFAGADLELYRAKVASGRRSVDRLHEAMRAVFERSELVKALDDNEIVPYYQPILEAVTGRLVGIEALARWHSPERGFLAPSAFITAFEAYSLQHQLSINMLVAAMRDRQVLLDSGAIDPSVRVHVNVSPSELDGSVDVEAATEYLHRRGHDLNGLTLELTETALLSSPAATQRILTRCQDFGIEIALDDFGTGYSSLTLLSVAPVDQLKIDKSFVDGVLSERESRAVIAAVVELGRHLGVPVTAEGVESHEQANELRTLGVSAVQGFLYSKPLPLDRLRDELLRRNAA